MKRTTSLLLLLLVGCVPPPPPPPAPPPAPPPEPQIVPFHAPVVWTAEPRVTVDPLGREPLKIRRPFTPLVTIGVDSVGLLVQCRICEDAPVGYVDPESIVYEAVPPEIAAFGSLGEFALSIRDAASRNDVEALRPVMASDFTSSFVGFQNPDAAFAVWRSEEFQTLDQVPSLLADGLDTIDGTIWSAPIRFVHDLDYRGLRLGFRQRADGRWEWLYLIRGVTG